MPARAVRAGLRAARSGGGPAVAEQRLFGLARGLGVVFLAGFLLLLLLRLRLLPGAGVATTPSASSEPSPFHPAGIRLRRLAVAVPNASAQQAASAQLLLAPYVAIAPPFPRPGLAWLSAASSLPLPAQDCADRLARAKALLRARSLVPSDGSVLPGTFLLDGTADVSLLLDATASASLDPADPLTSLTWSLLASPLTQWSGSGNATTSAVLSASLSALAASTLRPPPLPAYPLVPPPAWLPASARLASPALVDDLVRVTPPASGLAPGLWVVAATARTQAGRTSRATLPLLVNAKPVPVPSRRYYVPAAIPLLPATAPRGPLEAVAPLSEQGASYAAVRAAASALCGVALDASSTRDPDGPRPATVWAVDLGGSVLVNPALAPPAFVASTRGIRVVLANVTSLALLASVPSSSFTAATSAAAAVALARTGLPGLAGNVYAVTLTALDGYNASSSTRVWVGARFTPAVVGGPLRLVVEGDSAVLDFSASPTAWAGVARVILADWSVLTRPGGTVPAVSLGCPLNGTSNATGPAAPQNSTSTWLVGNSSTLAGPNSTGAAVSGPVPVGLPCAVLTNLTAPGEYAVRVVLYDNATGFWAASTLTVIRSPVPRPSLTATLVAPPVLGTGGALLFSARKSARGGNRTSTGPNNSSFLFSWSVLPAVPSSWPDDARTLFEPVLQPIKPVLEVPSSTEEGTALVPANSSSLGAGMNTSGGTGLVPVAVNRTVPAQWALLVTFPPSLAAGQLSFTVCVSVREAVSGGLSPRPFTTAAAVACLPVSSREVSAQPQPDPCVDGLVCPLEVFVPPKPELVSIPVWPSVPPPPEPPLSSAAIGGIAGAAVLLLAVSGAAWLFLRHRELILGLVRRITSCVTRTAFSRVKVVPEPLATEPAPEPAASEPAPEPAASEPVPIALDAAANSLNSELAGVEGIDEDAAAAVDAAAAELDEASAAGKEEGGSFAAPQPSFELEPSPAPAAPANKPDTSEPVASAAPVEPHSLSLPPSRPPSAAHGRVRHTRDEEIAEYLAKKAHAAQVKPHSTFSSSAAHELYKDIEKAHEYKQHVSAAEALPEAAISPSAGGHAPASRPASAAPHRPSTALRDSAPFHAPVAPHAPLAASAAAGSRPSSAARVGTARHSLPTRQTHHPAPPSAAAASPAPSRRASQAASAAPRAASSRPPSPEAPSAPATPVEEIRHWLELVVDSPVEPAAETIDDA